MYRCWKEVGHYPALNLPCTKLLTSFLSSLSQDPKSVHVSWQTYFKGLDGGLPSSEAYTPPPAYRAGLDVAVGHHPVDAAPGMSMAGAGGSEVTDHLKVSIRASDASIDQDGGC